MDRLVDRIYEAAFIPELWPSVLDEFGSRGGGVGGVLFTTDTKKITRWTASECLEPLVHGFIDGGWFERNPRLAAAAWVNGTTSFVREVDYLTSSEIATDPMYVNFLRPRGFSSHVGTAMELPSGDVAIMNIECPAGPASRDDVKRLDDLRPHLARAAMIATRLGLERATAAVEALALINLPAAVLGSQGRVLAVNQIFGTLQAYISVRGFDRLSFRRGASQLLFAAELERASRGQTGAVSIPLPATEGVSAAVAHLVPVQGLARDIFAGALALLVVTPLQAGAVPTTAMLRGLFDLTPAEARVARGIAEGSTIAVIAASQGVSRETVRSQVKAVLAKTGTGRQAELARILGSVALQSRP